MENKNDNLIPLKMADGWTDDSGPGKIGGIDFVRETSILELKAKAYGVAAVEAVLKNVAGEVLATDVFYVEVADELSLSDDISIAPLTNGSALAADDAGYGVSRFALSAAADMTLNMIVAEYDGSGKLVSTEVRPLTLAADTSVIEEVAVSGDNDCKVFFWDSSDVPVASAMIIR